MELTHGRCHNTNPTYFWSKLAPHAGRRGDHGDEPSGKCIVPIPCHSHTRGPHCSKHTPQSVTNQGEDGGKFVNHNTLKLQSQTMLQWHAPELPAEDLAIPHSNTATGGRVKQNITQELRQRIRAAEPESYEVEEALYRFATKVDAARYEYIRSCGGAAEGDAQPRDCGGTCALEVTEQEATWASMKISSTLGARCLV